MIIRNREELTDFVIPYPPKEMLATVSKKAEFYEMCDKFGIPHPDTVVLTKKTTADALSPEKLGFSYPIIVKPSSSVDYWKHSFDGMKKVYTADSPERAAGGIFPDGCKRDESVPGSRGGACAGDCFF